MRTPETNYTPSRFFDTLLSMHFFPLPARSRRRRPWLAATLATLALCAGAAAANVAQTAAPAHATESPLSAPAGTSTIWIDLESDAAGQASPTFSLRQLGDWVDAVAARTPAGSGAAFAAVPGAANVRFRAETAFTADLAITFAEESGRVLTDQRHRNVLLDPAEAGEDGWITLSQLLNTENGTEPGTDPTTDPTSEPGTDPTGDPSTDPGTAPTSRPVTEPGKPADELSRTGDASAMPLLTGALLLALTGAAIVVVAHGRRNVRAATTDKISGSISEGTEG